MAAAATVPAWLVIGEKIINVTSTVIGTIIEVWKAVVTFCGPDSRDDDHNPDPHPGPPNPVDPHPDPYPVDPHPVVKMNPPSVTGYAKLEGPLDEVRRSLRDKDKVILIYGTIGTGKTTIMQNLNDDDELGREYDIIIWLDVSSDDPENFGKKKNIGYEKLRKDFMQRLNISDRTVGSDEEKIKKFLKNKKYLLLLDNVKAPLDLDKIGFPRNWRETGSKVVITSRFNDFGLRQMIDHVVTVKLLSPEDATVMFNSYFSNRSKFKKSIQIHKAIECCGCLPFVIAIVAGYLNKSAGDDDLKERVNSITTWPSDNKLINSLYETLSFCYRDLTNKQKACFYYAALYPEGKDIYKDRLLDGWIAENKLVAYRGEGRRLLFEFMEKNLLKKKSYSFITMPKLIRLLALYNLRDTETPETPKCLVKSRQVSPDDQVEDSWEGKHWISLADNNWEPVQDGSNCSNLSILFLQENSSLTEFPDSFFCGMGSLRVLDLMGTGIVSLPDSLKHLTELAVLYLNECSSLIDLPSVMKELKNLEVLDITGCSITGITEIKNLKNLKRFRVSISAISGTCNSLGVISELTELNELLIDTKSEKETFDWNSIKPVMENVKTLKKLTSLQFRFLSDEVVVVWRWEGEVRKFFGCSIRPEAEMHILFQSYIDKWSGREPSSTAVGLLSMSDALVMIAGSDDLEDLTTFDFPNSATILVENCKRITYILGPLNPLLSSLEQLYLNNLDNLESVTLGSIHLSSFGELKILKLYSCPLLTNIITNDPVESMGENSTSAVQNIDPVFPKLKELVLSDLPKLESIWKNESLEFPSLIKLEITECPALKYLPISPNNIQKLKSIKTTRTWWGALHREDPAAETYFQDIVDYDDYGQTSSSQNLN